MTDEDLIGDRWTYNHGDRIYRRLPYDECPHCGKYEYTTHERNVLFSDNERWNECENCRYKEEIDNNG